MSNIIKEHQVNEWIQRITVEKLEKALELIENKKVYEFNSYCYSDLVVIDYNWAGWTEGRNFVSSDDWDFKDKDELFCYRLNTVLLRNDRFCDGVLKKYVENGLLKVAFERLIELKKVSK